VNSLERPHSEGNRRPLPPAAPHDPRTDHPIVSEAYGWVIAQVIAGITHEQVGNLVAQWEHFDELTMPDMVNLLRRFAAKGGRS
jgi:hypothetical protein